MRHEIPSVRILPMSDKAEGFVGLSIEEVQKRKFLRGLGIGKGKYHYRSTGLNAEPGTVVLFQFKAHIIASAVFERDEKFDRPAAGHSGVLHFEPNSIRTFDPLDLEAMRKIWPRMPALGHVKRFLNPALYPKFQRSLKNVASPVGAR
jgi:hypothetical protein